MDISAFGAGFIIVLSDATILFLLIRMLIGQFQPVVSQKIAGPEDSAVPSWVRAVISGCLLIAKTFFLLFATWLSLNKWGLGAGSFAGGAAAALMVFVLFFFLLYRKKSPVL